MESSYPTIHCHAVALLAEGVDRNSLAASCSHIASSVALLAEGVDRNIRLELSRRSFWSRPPRGGRG